MIDDLWANPEQLPESEAVLRDAQAPARARCSRRAGRCRSWSGRRSPSARPRRSTSTRTWTRRTSTWLAIMKCCVGVPEADGSNIPTCSYNVLYREKDPRFADPEMLERMNAARPGARGGHASGEVATRGRAMLAACPIVRSHELHRAPPTPAAREVFHSFTKGICPICRELVDGARIIRDGKVYLRKQCPRHGQPGGADLRRRRLVPEVVRPTSSQGSVPLKYSTPVADGLPARTAASAPTTSSTPACRSSRSPTTATSSARSASCRTGTTTT